MTDQHASIAPLVADTAPMILDTPRIYVACLAAYNNGRLHGRWIDATDPHEVWEQVNAMLAASPEPDAEEWAIHDYDNFYGCNIPEYAGFDTVCEIATFLEEHGELGAKLYECFASDLDQARAAFDEYAGEYLSPADFAEQLHEDIGTQMSQSLRYYIDWGALAGDMALNGEIVVFQTGFDEVHVFWRR